MSIPSFRLQDLGWHAFQQFCHTVLREVLGQQVVSFLDGNDGGRDGAFAGTWSPTGLSHFEGEFVFQCKHTALINQNISLSDLEDEMDKVERLALAGRCDVYVLITNAGVTGESEGKITSAIKARGAKHVMILGASWLNQTIVESSRLRRLVPRLYGLGDLTQILDDRAYRQAQAVLDAMRSDLDKFVLTGTYERAAMALAEHGFVLLLGAPATGKTTIAAQLALGATDDFDTTVVKIDTISNLQDRWNPDEPQLFWLDDAFGATQFDRSLALSWTSSITRVDAAIKNGSMFVLTSRDYIFKAAYNFLKPGSFPLLNESQVVVDVADLSLDERRQILYNHLRLGRQTNADLGRLTPNLEAAAVHPGFTPELARRLGDPVFTRRLTSEAPDSIATFFSRPRDYLRDVIAGLDEDARAALGLIFVNHDWLRSPLRLGARESDLVARFGSNLGGVTTALGTMRGSLLQHIVRDGESGWVFAHPTMIEAYADLIRTSPELLDHLLFGAPIDVLLAEVTCGDVGVEGAVIVPNASYVIMLDRLEESPNDLDETWRARSKRAVFLTTRCSVEFLRLWIERDSARLRSLATPGLMLEADSNNELVARLSEFGLYPEEMRSSFARELIDLCLTGVDPAVLWNDRLASLLTVNERDSLLQRVRSELLTNFGEAISNCTDGWDRESGPDSAIQPLRELVYHLPEIFPFDASVQLLANEFVQLLDEWVADRDYEIPTQRTRQPAVKVSTFQNGTATNERSVFDDLVEGRGPIVR